MCKTMAGFYGSQLDAQGKAESAKRQELWRAQREARS
jgi:hypothetical protein